MGGTEKRRNNKPTEPKLTKETSLSKIWENLAKKTEGVGTENECFLCGAGDASLCKACGIVAACDLHTSHHQVAIFVFNFVIAFILVQTSSSS